MNIKAIAAIGLAAVGVGAVAVTILGIGLPTGGGDRRDHHLGKLTRRALIGAARAVGGLGPDRLTSGSARS